MIFKALNKIIRNNKGIALVTVLFIATLASIMVVSMTFDEQVTIRRTGNLIEGDQAIVIAKGVISWGGQVLVDDSKKGKTDNLDEDWAFGLPPTKIEGGVVSGELEDLQSRFNLNNLVYANANVLTEIRGQFRRMLDLCDINTDIDKVVIDWLDDNVQIEIPNGAEDSAYSYLDVPYRTANYKMADPSELMLVLGLDAKEYSCLSPYITALPEETEININTASAFVIASLDDNISLTDAKNLVENRPKYGYKDVDDFINEPILAGIWTGKTPTSTIVPTAIMSVESDFFQARADVRVGNSEITLYSLLQRKAQSGGNQATVEVLNRTIGSMDDS